MKKYDLPCNVIIDLLPLYNEGGCSEESRQIVEEHLQNCENCRELCGNPLSSCIIWSLRCITRFLRRDPSHVGLFFEPLPKVGADGQLSRNKILKRAR